MRMKPKPLNEALQDILTEEEISLIGRAYDMVGDIAIIEIPEALESKEEAIAQRLLELHKNINVVAKKEGIHDGEFRTMPLCVLAGEERKETLCKENGCRLYLDVEQCYFSPRSGNERKRIAGLIQEGEHVLVMFSGVGPFVLVIAKNTKAAHVVGVEKNPIAHDYAEKNVKGNKVSNVTLHCGDVADIVPTLAGPFDRVVMPLPKTGEDFLEIAIDAVKRGGYIHFYDFQHHDTFSEAEEKVRAACTRKGRRCVHTELVTCGQYAPRVNRVCVDTQVE